VDRDGQFATVLCGLVDVAGHRITLANAGHPNPLVVGDGTARYATTTIGPPVGVAGQATYTEATISVPENATLLAYTDGLIERRGENIDVGSERLRDAALSSHGSVEDLLTSILAASIPTGAADDTAILGLRWSK
jgi:serine phosphatase RsbU (regulator of sigma subunit)